ncbi:MULTISPECIES: cysteine metabolism transcriptional regulator CymR [Listeria]|uniref:Rrf2 family transcriptional regulator n=2 Tax=Listeria TaxID=1637 RepID=A0A099WAF8_9LIST|nr:MULTISPECIES: Rrf2 family transcriptional regulator [Listeria]EUJ46232.1 Rrf2 family transcriptional regulator protein [Listeria riparia FSL S10-1204]KGL41423.1 Rrf2 family transcriptional regulator [Listeria booriae]MBC1211637.1 Rrf2 family transcriptional regulator [Listeria booriae]MBC1226619.1 Rrf2 family transcriptional regulator [Listeria booriae]MBC1230057.1 Rrf2 family transcriptional regulator [Listeria booriae]
MKITTKGRYGLTIVLELTRCFGQGPISLRSIAEKKGLSEHYLEQLIGPLRNAGIVKSIRGAHGGYILGDEPAKITAGDIIRTLEGPIVLVESIEDEEAAQRELWMRIRNAVKDVLDSTTLEDLASHGDDPLVDGYMFYI